eukprot:6180256-Pleurochrysis_carterae.AAC.1
MQPLHLADLVLTVTYDVASLPADKVCRFDESSVEYSASSNEQMNKYICMELRMMVTGFTRMHEPAGRVAPGSFKLSSSQQLVQVDFYAPPEIFSTQTNAAASSAQASVRGTVSTV